jgi:hypothetical protein
MRFIYIVLCLLFVLFTGVQYNDPDFYIWMPIYIVPAIWAGLAAFKPEPLRTGPARGLLALCIVLAFAASAWYWPTAEGFWRQEVYWESETSREGMGMMIATIALLLILPATRARRNQE